MKDFATYTVMLVCWLVEKWVWKGATVEFAIKGGKHGKRERSKVAQEAQAVAAVDSFHCFKHFTMKKLFFFSVPAGGKLKEQLGYFMWISRDAEKYNNAFIWLSGDDLGL